MPHKKVALQLIEETLKELESPKGSLLSAIQNYSGLRISSMMMIKRYGVLFN